MKHKQSDTERQLVHRLRRSLGRLRRGGKELSGLELREVKCPHCKGLGYLTVSGDSKPILQDRIADLRESLEAEWEQVQQLRTLLHIPDDIGLQPGF